jgi:DoxX-like family
MRDLRLLRWSLALLWLLTALVSILEVHGQSQELLALTGISDANIAFVLIVSGAALDATLGVWMLFWPSRRLFVCALVAMLGMTLLATGLHPAWWLHPLGPLTKNIPIAAVLWLLIGNKS